MTRSLIRNSLLFDLAEKLDLDYPIGQGAWGEHLEKYLPFDTIQRLQSFQENINDPNSGIEIELEFNDFISRDNDLAKVILEGRLGYYDAILPKLIEQIKRVPHKRILDLGAQAGIVSLCLAKAFPDSEIIGVDCCAGWVDYALRQKTALELENIDFSFWDYTEFKDEEGFDVVISLMTMPVFLLPEIPSESPDTHFRGYKLDDMLSEFENKHPVAKCLNSIASLCKSGGTAIIQERLAHLSQTLMFTRLAHKAGLEISKISPVHFNIVCESDFDQEAPFIVATTSLPAEDSNYTSDPVDEESLIDLYFPTAWSLDLVNEEAEFYYASLPENRNQITARLEFKDGNQMNVHVGITESVSFIYTTTSKDFREIHVCHNVSALPILSNKLEELGFYWFSPNLTKSTLSTEDLIAFLDNGLRLKEVPN